MDRRARAADQGPPVPRHVHQDRDGYYGTKTLTKGHDDDGNLLLWWASGSTELEQGHSYELTATIKAHDTDSYQGDAKVTVITRVHGPSVKDITEEALALSS